MSDLLCSSVKMTEDFADTGLMTSGPARVIVTTALDGQYILFVFPRKSKWLLLPEQKSKSGLVTRFPQTIYLWGFLSSTCKREEWDFLTGKHQRVSYTFMGRHRILPGIHLTHDEGILA